MTIETLLLQPEALPFAELVLAMVLGMLLGLERFVAGKTAGMRTHALVSMGAALFIVVANLLGVRLPDAVFNPLIVIGSIITGIGFLGAGLIIKEEDNRPHGLTTAAGLWVAAGIGVAVGCGFYILAVLTTLLTLFVFHVLWFVEHIFSPRKNGEEKN